MNKIALLLILSVFLFACSEEKKETKEDQMIQEFEKEIQQFQHEIEKVEQEYEEVQKNRPKDENRTVPKFKAHFRKLIELEQRRKELEMKIRDRKLKIRQLQQEQKLKNANR